MNPTTSVQINRIRALLAWCEDHAHTLPDGWTATVNLLGLQIIWGARATDHADEVAEALRETYGQPDDVSHGGESTWAEWERTEDRPELIVFGVTLPEDVTA